MQTSLTYTVIHSSRQYKRYCHRLEALVCSGKPTKKHREEIELLTLLIEHYDEQHRSLPKTDPVDFLKSLMKEHGLKAVDLARILDVGENLVSEMLNRKKGLSKRSIGILSRYFKVRQEAFNR